MVRFGNGSTGDSDPGGIARHDIDLELRGRRDHHPAPTVDSGVGDGGVNDTGGDDGSSTIDASDGAITDSSDAAPDSGPTEPPKTNLVLWLRADVGVVALAGKVMAWNDQSGLGARPGNIDTPLQPSAPQPDPPFGNQYTIGFPTADPEALGGSPFLGVQQLPTSLGPVLTYYFVYRSGNAANTNGHVVFEGNTGGDDYQSLRINSDGASWSMTFTSVPTGGATTSVEATNLPLATITKPHFVVIVADGAGSALFLDRHTTPTATGTLAAAKQVGLQIGAKANGTLGINGAIAEILAYDGAHDAAKRDSVARYVSSRYALPIAP